MGVGHTHVLYVHEHSPIHALAPEAKIAGAVGVVAAAALTPRQAIWAFALYALVVASIVAVSRVPPRFLAIRLLALVPFVLFALVIPFVASGETIDVLGVPLSLEGLWGSWNILIKALIGGSVSIVLTATTEVPEIIRGLGLLRVPVLMTSIATFMIRYLELTVDELRRMRLAMTARGYDPSWLAQARPIASAAGALFVRSYERGERVHDAMLSRGFTGVMPGFGHRSATRAEWAQVALVVSICVLTATVALVVT